MFSLFPKHRINTHTYTHSFTHAVELLPKIINNEEHIRLSKGSGDEGGEEEEEEAGEEEGEEEGGHEATSKTPLIGGGSRPHLS